MMSINTPSTHYLNDQNNEKFTTEVTCSIVKPALLTLNYYLFFKTLANEKKNKKTNAPEEIPQSPNTIGFNYILNKLSQPMITINSS